MPKRKNHVFKANKNIKGFYRCKNCNAEMQYNASQTKFTITRGGIIDNSTTRMNCFKLSKE